jgi:hypothetical protein
LRHADRYANRTNGCRKNFYRSSQDGGSIFEKNTNSTGTEQLLLKARTNGPSQVSPDGKFRLYFAIPARRLEHDIFVLQLTGERRPYPVMSGIANQAASR